MEYLLIIAVAAALSYLGERLMALQLKRQQALLEEWDEKLCLPVCRPVVLFVGTVLLLQFGWALPVTVAGKLFSCAFLYLLWLVAIVDYKYRFIFDDSNIALGALGLIAAPFLPVPLMEQAIGAAAGFAVMFLLAVLGRGALGGGDVKLVAVLGWWFGWRSLPVLLCVGFILGGVGAVLMLIFTKKDRKAMFAFGPYLIFGALVAWLLMARQF